MDQIRVRESIIDYIESKKRFVIMPANESWGNILTEIVSNRLKKGRLDVGDMVSEICVHNRDIFESIAEYAIDTDSVGYLVDPNFIDMSNKGDAILDISEIVEEYFFGNNQFCEDMLQIIENMLYEFLSKTGLPAYIPKEQISDYPIFIRRFSNENSELEYLPDDRGIAAHINHAQLLMFNELLPDGSCHYGRQHILIIDHKGGERIERIE